MDYFREQGLYDGLFLMADERTGSYWNHMTGEAVHGQQAGKRLELENVLHTTVAQALAEDPETRLAWSEHPRALQRSERGGTLATLLGRIRGLPEIFPATLGAEDDRRPRMDIGIGIWSDGGGARYYAMETVQERDNAVLDMFDDQQVLVYYDPTTYSLAAHFTDVETVWWEEDVLHMSSGERIEEGIRFEADGSRADRGRPLQVYTRWYGFSLTFPESEVYGDGGG